jgi:hypothetical protein
MSCPFFCCFANLDSLVAGLAAPSLLMQLYKRSVKRKDIIAVPLSGLSAITLFTARRVPSVSPSHGSKGVADKGMAFYFHPASLLLPL